MGQRLPQRPSYGCLYRGDARSGAAVTQGLLRLRQASERDTQEHIREILARRLEVEDAAHAAEMYMQRNYDEKTSKWRHEELLQPGCKVLAFSED